MNGECKSFRLNDPMTWKEFMSMPDDIKITYIKLLRQKFNVPDKNIAEMFGVCKDHVCRTFKKLGLQRDVRISHPKWDKEGFYAWWHGVDQLPTPVIEETAEEPVIEEVPVITSEEPEVYVEDDLPIEEQSCACTFVPMEQCMAIDAENAALKARIDELLKSNEELVAVHEKNKAEIAWLRNECDRHQKDALILEKQMEVVRLIFGGKNHD